MIKISIRDKFSAIPQFLLDKWKKQQEDLKLQAPDALLHFFKNIAKFMDEYYTDGDGATMYLDYEWLPNIKEVLNENDGNELAALILQARSKGKTDKEIARTLKYAWEGSGDNIEINHHYGIPKYSIHISSVDEIEEQVRDDEVFEKWSKGMNEEQIKEIANRADLYYDNGFVTQYVGGRVYGAVVKPGSSAFEDFKEWVESEE